MNKQRTTLLLVGFLCLFVGLWVLPVLLAGFPFRLPYLEHAKEFWFSGVFPSDNQRLTPILVAWFSPLIGWNNVFGWVLLSCVWMAGALLALWHTVRKFFDAQTAWAATAIFGAFPLTWFQALALNGYALMYLCLFLCILSFAALHPDFAPKKKRWFLFTQKEPAYQSTLAVACCGFLYGLAVICRDAIIILVPWLMFCYVWMHKKEWKKSAAEALLFFVIVGSVFSFSFVVRAVMPNMAPSERLEMLLSARQLREGSYGHFYRDQYTYELAKEEYVEEKNTQFAESSWLTKMQEKNYFVMFGAQEGSLLGGLTTGAWLFVNKLPLFIKQTTIGGLFMWLFIVPGIAVLWRERRQLLLLMAGTYIAMEFVLRFVFQFSRDHLVNLTWMLAILAGVGVVHIAGQLSKTSKRISQPAVAIFITLVIVLQCAQATRTWFADLYGKSTTMIAYAGKPILSDVPENAVIAHSGAMREAFYFVERERIYFHDKTLQKLAKEGGIQKAFKHYGVTHLLGFSEEIRNEAQRQMPSVTLVPLISEDDAQVEVTPVMGYLLNLIR